MFHTVYVPCLHPKMAVSGLEEEVAEQEDDSEEEEQAANVTLMSINNVISWSSIPPAEI